MISIQNLIDTKEYRAIYPQDKRPHSPCFDFIKKTLTGPLLAHTAAPREKQDALLAESKGEYVSLCLSFSLKLNSNAASKDSEMLK